MTRRVLGAQLRLIRPREVIRADWLNEVAATAERNANKLDDIETEVPEGEDGAGSNMDKTYSEDRSQRVETTTERIEDQTDPTVFVEFLLTDEAVFINDKDPTDVLRLKWDHS